MKGSLPLQSGPLATLSLPLTMTGCFFAVISGVRLLACFGISAFLMSKASSPSA